MPPTARHQPPKRTGETVTPAAGERLRHFSPIAAALLEIGQRCAALPDLETRTADEILGYDRHGLPN